LVIVRLAPLAILQWSRRDHDVSGRQDRSRTGTKPWPAAAVRHPAIAL